MVSAKDAWAAELMQSQGDLQGIAAVGITLGFLFLTIAIFVILGIVSNRSVRKTVALLKETSGGTHIPLIAAFTGVKGVPWVALSWSSLAPRLILQEQDFHYQAIRLERRPYSDIASVDLHTTIGTVNIVLAFRDSVLTFAGNTGSKDIAAKALAILQQKGCPLTPRARALLSME